MPTEKRQRQDEARLNKRVEMRTASKRQARTKNARNLGLILVALLGVAFLVSVLGGDDDETVDAGSSTTTIDPTSSTTPEAVEVTYPGPGEAIKGDTPCPKADGSSKRTTSFEKAPSTCITPAKTYVATVETTEGTMEFTLDAETAPVTVNNFVVLARYHFYDGVPFHRIMPGFVDQAGTPVDQASPEIATNPGYTIDEELPEATDPAAVYPDGTLAMAKQEAPSTSSSQFFIVIGDGGSQLTVTYTPFGRVTKGLEVAKAINAFGNSATNGEPTKAISITKVTISET